MNGTDDASGRLGAVLRAVGEPGPVALGRHGPYLVTTLSHARDVLTDPRSYDFPMNVSRRPLSTDAEDADAAGTERSPHAITPPLDAEAVSRGTEVFDDQLGRLATELSAGSTVDAMQWLRAPVARSTTAAVLPHLQEGDRDHLGDLVLAWIDSLGPIIASPRNLPRWTRARRLERRCHGLVQEKLADHGCPDPAATATMLAAGIQVPIAAGAWLLVKLAEDPAMTRTVRSRPELARDVAWETVRLCPPTWITARITSVAVELGSTTLPAGVVVMVSPLLLGRLESLAPGSESGASPLDRFDPLRWDQDRLRPGAWLPFGAGPHACPGRSLGMVQLSHLATWAARDWDWTPMAAVEVDQSRGIFPSPAVLGISAPSLGPHDNLDPVADRQDGTVRDV